VPRLIIEDELLIAMMIEALVEDEGATSCDIATTEREAIAAALAHPPDVITSDVQLREGTGPQAVAKITECLGERPVIFITGNPEICKPRLPSSVLLTKPLSKTALHEAFHGFC